MLVVVPPLLLASCFLLGHVTVVCLREISELIWSLKI